jgi:hypothetical protein
MSCMCDLERGVMERTDGLALKEGGRCNASDRGAFLNF